jgi:hypothetical protein
MLLVVPGPVVSGLRLPTSETLNVRSAACARAAAYRRQQAANALPTATRSLAAPTARLLAHPHRGDYITQTQR